MTIRNSEDSAKRPHMWPLDPLSNDGPPAKKLAAEKPNKPPDEELQIVSQQRVILSQVEVERQLRGKGLPADKRCNLCMAENIYGKCILKLVPGYDCPRCERCVDLNRAETCDAEYYLSPPNIPHSLGDDRITTEGPLERFLQVNLDSANKQIVEASTKIRQVHEMRKKAQEIEEKALDELTNGYERKMVARAGYWAYAASSSP